MLKKTEADNLKNDIRDEQNKAMKDILHHAEMALDENKYKLFKKIVFNNFGKSGLDTSVEKIIQKYVGE